MSYAIVPDPKTRIEVDSPSLALDVAGALGRLGLVTLTGDVVKCEPTAEGVVLLTTSSPVGFASDGEVRIEVSGNGAYDGTYGVVVNGPTVLALADATPAGLVHGGTWRTV